MQTQVDKFKNMKFKPGQIAYHKTKGNCIVMDYFTSKPAMLDQDLPLSGQPLALEPVPDYGFVIINKDGDKDIVSEEDLLPLNRVTRVLYE